MLHCPLGEILTLGNRVEPLFFLDHNRRNTPLAQIDGKSEANRTTSDDRHLGVQVIQNSFSL